MSTSETEAYQSARRFQRDNQDDPSKSAALYHLGTMLAIIDDQDRVIRDCLRRETRLNMKLAEARLIAAAPCLYGALQMKDRVM